MNFSENFAEAFKYLLGDEGGYVDNLEDSGGATNMGITEATLSIWRKQPVTPYDVQNLTLGEAQAIYYEEYWSPLKLDSINELVVAICIFDQAVLYGQRIAVEYAQKACIACGAELVPDGILGPGTLQAINSLSKENFVKNFHALIINRIETLCAEAPKNVVFRDGWEERADRLLSLV